MAPMESSLLKNELSPEERVRQDFFRLMVEERGFSPSHIVMERELSLLPHVAGQESVPQRRIDLLAYEKKSMGPLLLVECKAVKLAEEHVLQLLGYNTFVKAPFVTLVNQVQVMTGWLIKGEFRFVNRLPDYDELIIKARALIS